MTHRLMVAERQRYEIPVEPKIDLRKAPRKGRGRLRKAEKLLKRFDAWPKRRVEKTQWFEFDGRSIIHGILRNRSDAEAVYGGSIERVLIGRDMLGPLDNEMMDAAGPFSWRGDIPMHGPHGRRIVNLDVQYVPWMRGVLLVPDFEKGR